MIGAVSAVSATNRFEIAKQIAATAIAIAGVFRNVIVNLLASSRGFCQIS
jgi:hypothetical protein